MSHCIAIDDLPVGSAPAPVSLPHFPDALHAVVWRNWDVVDAPRLAGMLGATPAQLSELAGSMGLPPQRRIAPDEIARNYMTIIRRNWHLLPYEQLCELLGWDAAQMLYSLNEDDFMWVKLGGYKPRCEPVRYAPPDESARRRAGEIRRMIQRELGAALNEACEPPFGFIDRFNASVTSAGADADALRMVYPYFLRFGDPLVGDGIDDIPEGYLAQLQSCGVNAIWFQALLNKLYPWDLAPALSQGWQERIENLKRLVARCGKYGIDVMLYLNEPRAMPPEFFDEYPELRGVGETPDRAPYSPNVIALCTSTKPVQDFLVNSIRHLFQQVPELGGVFTITYSENLTNCWSRKYESDQVDPFAFTTAQETAKACPRCKQRPPAAIHAEINALIDRGMSLAGAETARLLWYVWSTPAEWVGGLIDGLPPRTQVLAVSEWGTPFTRGDYSGKVNEYSISVVGPSQQSIAQWKLAQQRGLKTVAKIQAANSWELPSVPYIPALRLVAEHMRNLAQAGVDGLMLGWSLGGAPSPNLDIAREFARDPLPGVQEAMRAAAVRRFGEPAADDVVHAWNLFSDAFSEMPFDVSLAYNGPQGLGPANLLFPKPSGFHSTMVTFPFDDLDTWRGPYSSQTFQRQFEKVASMWQGGVQALDTLRRQHPSAAMEDEYRIALACQFHFQSSANQIRFVCIRESDPSQARAIAQAEIELARQLFHLVDQDSRIGFEATNQYGYVRLDLAEKILNCHDLIGTL